MRGAGPILRAHRHSGTDAGTPHRARRVALACEVVSEDDIPRSKTPRRAIADPDFHLPFENKNVLPPGRGVPIARIVRRETAEHEVGARLNRNVVALLSRQREILKMGLAALARIYPYGSCACPPKRIIMHAKADSALSPTTKPLASRLHTLPPECGQKHQAHCRLPPPDLMLGGTVKLGESSLVRGGLLGRRIRGEQPERLAANEAGCARISL